MRIVFLNPIGQLGGGERSLLDLMMSVRAVDPAIQMTLVAGGEGPLIERASQLGLGSMLLRLPPQVAELGDSGSQVSLAGTLRSLCRAALPARAYARSLREVVAAADGPTILHSNGLKMHLLARLAGLRDVRTIWHIRDFVGRRPVAGGLLRWAAGTGGNVRAIAVSRAVASDFAAVLGEVAERVPIDVIYDGIDTTHFASEGSRASLDRLSDLDPAPEQTIRVGLVATYARWKGHDLFLHAARRVLDAPPLVPVRFYIIGGPIYATTGSQFSEHELRAMARQIGVAEHVGFIPFQADPAAVYRALDVVAHASVEPEPFGRTIVEAMSCGRAIIATAAGGAGEIVTDGVDALAVGPRDVEQLAAAIARLCRDAALRARIGAGGRATAVSRFSRERLGREMLGVYCSGARR